MFLAHYFKEIKALKPYFITIVTVVFLSYIIYAFCSEDMIVNLGTEDGFFEWLTAIFSLAASIIFILVFRRTKNIFLLGLGFIFFMGAGEEISWGQRVFNFDTPESIKKVNVQREFNLHNLELFNDSSLEHKKKKGFERLLEINMLYRIFSVTFCILIPLFFLYIKPQWAGNMNKKIRMPVVPVTIGVFFFISWAIFYSLKYAILPRGRIIWYYLSSGEIFEFTASFVYFLIALYFFKRKDDGFLGKYPVLDK